MRRREQPTPLLAADATHRRRRLGAGSAGARHPVAGLRREQVAACARQGETECSGLRAAASLWLLAWGGRLPIDGLAPHSQTVRPKLTDEQKANLKTCFKYMDAGGCWEHSWFCRTWSACWEAVSVSEALCCCGQLHLPASTLCRLLGCLHCCLAAPVQMDLGPSMLGSWAPPSRCMPSARSTVHANSAVARAAPHAHLPRATAQPFKSKLPQQFTRAKPLLCARCCLPCSCWA